MSLLHICAVLDLTTWMCEISNDMYASVLWEAHQEQSEFESCRAHAVRFVSPRTIVMHVS